MSDRILNVAITVKVMKETMLAELNDKRYETIEDLFKNTLENQAWLEGVFTGSITTIKTL